MAYNTNEERLLVKGSEQITRDLKVNRDTYIGETLDTKNLIIEDDLNVKGEAIFDDDVAIHGDLYVEGTTTTTSEAQVSSSGNYVVTRDNNATPLATGEYSGLAVNNYATGKIATITADKEGTWRISDSATASATTYTNISAYNGVYYTGLTQTTTTGPSGILTNVDADELASVVKNGSSYYHKAGNDWFGPVTLVSNALDVGSIVTSSTLINTLNGLTKHDLVYYRSATDKSIDASTNQPLLTRNEEANLTNNNLLSWDGTNKRAVDSGISKTMDTTPTANSTKLVTSGGVKTYVDNAIDALDVASVGGDTKYISAISETNGKISATVKDVAQTYSSTGTTAASGKAIAAAIGTLDVASVGGSGKYISAISETDGKISATSTTMDTAPTADSAKAVTSGGVKTAIDAEATARNTAITNAINALDVSSVGGAGKYISAISETDGKISATSTTMDTAPTANSTNAVTSGGIKTAINTAETNAKNLANATGTLAIAHGGTGVTSQANINCNIIANLAVGDSDVTDGTMFVSSYASDDGFADTNAVNKPYKRQFVHVWNYIKGKISSVLGLTATTYGGKATTAGTADQADKGKNGSAYCAFGSNAFNSTAFTTCVGTVTIADKAAANANTPVALCTGATTVGKSGSCGLNFNTCNGVLSAAQTSVTNATASGWSRAPIFMSASASGASKVSNVVIRACCTNANSALTCRNFTFCGSTGYMHGNVCGNLCGTASCAAKATNVSGTVAIANGGTGATTAATARTCLGLGDISTISKNNCTTQFLRGDGTWASVPASGGTVTIADVDSNVNYPIALCTDATSVGRSTACTLTFSPSTGLLNTVCILAIDNIRTGYLLPRPIIFQSGISNLVLAACCRYCNPSTGCVTDHVCGYTLCACDWKLHRYGNASSRYLIDNSCTYANNSCVCILSTTGTEYSIYRSRIDYDKRRGFVIFCYNGQIPAGTSTALCVKIKDGTEQLTQQEYSDIARSTMQLTMLSESGLQAGFEAEGVNYVCTINTGGMLTSGDICDVFCIGWHNRNGSSAWCNPKILLKWDF